jgi:hypothetical protein
MEPAFTFQPANLTVQIVGVGIMIIAPFVFGAIAHRRLGVGWRVFWMAGLVFVVSQMLLRLPIVGALQVVLAPQTTNSRSWFCGGPPAGVYRRAVRDGWPLCTVSYTSSILMMSKGRGFWLHQGIS